MTKAMLWISEIISFSNIARSMECGYRENSVSTRREVLRKRLCLLMLRISSVRNPPNKVRTTGRNTGRLLMMEVYSSVTAMPSVCIPIILLVGRNCLKTIARMRVIRPLGISPTSFLIRIFPIAIRKGNVLIRVSINSVLPVFI